MVNDTANLAFILCDGCGDRIGVYERIQWQRPDGSVVVCASRAARDQDADEPSEGSRVFHLTCPVPEPT